MRGSRRGSRWPGSLRHCASCSGAASGKLHTIVPQEWSDSPLIEGLRKNSSLISVTLPGVTKKQEEEILRIVRANARMPVDARFALGHALASSISKSGVLADAGTAIVNNLSAWDLRAVAALDHGTSQARRQGQLIDLVRYGNVRGITALCAKWEKMGIGLDKPVLDKVLEVACEQVKDAKAAASTARAVLQAIVTVKQRNGLAAYVPSDAKLKQLAQLADKTGDQSLAALLKSLQSPA